MPRLIQPPSLRKVSLQSIADNYSYWCDGQSASDPDFVSPFQYLCDDMVQDLIDILTDSIDCFDKLRFLFHHNLRRLDIHCFLFEPCRNITDISIQSLNTRCQRLTHLNLQGQRQVHTQVLCELVTRLPRLISLQIAETNTDRTVLKAIADHCPDLVDLNVEDCNDLRDTDFLLLCDQLEHSRSGPQFKKLGLSEAIYGISEDTVVSLLKSHRHLQSLGKCELIAEAIGQMYGDKYMFKKEIPDTWKHNLSDVKINGYHNPEFDLEFVFRCCPYITTLSLHVFEEPIHLPSLNAASNLTNLKTIHFFGRGTDETVTFEYIVPILQKIGRNLTTLRLRGFHEVSVIRIGELCPNLQRFDIRSSKSSVSSYTHTAVNESFRQLRVLRVGHFAWEDEDVIPTEVLSMILENAIEVKDIRFCHLSNLTDSMISAASMKHSFPSLTHAEFVHCSSVTKETGMVLLTPDNPLETLIFYECENITIEDQHNLKQYAEQRRFNLNVSSDFQL